MNSTDDKLHIRSKLITIALVSVIGMLLTILLFYQGLKTTLEQNKEMESQQLANTGLSIIRHFYQSALDDKMSEVEARTLAFQTLQATRFGSNGYFWINNSQSVLLMHPFTPELVGQDLQEMRDIKGNQLFANITQTALNGGGLVSYYWPKPNTSQSYPKLSYVAYFKPWDWVIGTGTYLDDMEKEIRNYAISALSIGIAVILLAVIFTMLLTQKIMFELESMAIRDPLTSLYTRRFLNDQITNLLMRHQRKPEQFLEVIFLDIDYFKKVNDCYGHSTGDRVLTTVSRIIVESSRPEDLCVRYGGEEFVIILLTEHKNAAHQLAERIRKATQRTSFETENTEFSVTISAGIAIRESDEALELTLQRADAKLYEAKSKGRNCIEC